MPRMINGIMLYRIARKYIHSILSPAVLPISAGVISFPAPLVVNGSAGAAAGCDQLARDGPGLVRGQERGEVANLGGVDHAADVVAAA